MTQPTYIDEHGNLHEGGMARLEDLMRTIGSAPWLSEFVVKSMGFVAVKSVGPSAHVKLRPRLTGDLTLIRLMEWIDSTPKGATVVSSYCEETGRWLSSLYPSKSAAIAEIADQMLREELLRNQRVLVRTEALADYQPSHPFSIASKYWAAIGDSDGRAFCDATVGNCFKDRYVLFRYEPNARLVLIDEVGPAKPDHARYELESMLGRSVKEQPDAWYGRSCNDAFVSTIESGEPIVQCVDAIVDWPARRATRHKYRRIMLPFRSAGHQWLLSGAIEDLALDLGRKRA